MDDKARFARILSAAHGLHAMGQARVENCQAIEQRRYRLRQRPLLQPCGGVEAPPVVKRLAFHYEGLAAGELAAIPVGEREDVGERAVPRIGVHALLAPIHIVR